MMFFWMVQFFFKKMLVATFFDTDNKLVRIVKCTKTCQPTFKAWEMIGAGRSRLNYDGSFYIKTQCGRSKSTSDSSDDPMNYFDNTTCHQLSYVDTRHDLSVSKNCIFVNNEPIDVVLGTFSNGGKFGLRYEAILTRLSDEDCVRLYDDYSKGQHLSTKKTSRKDLLNPFCIKDGSMISGRIAEKVAKVWLRQHGATLIKGSKGGFRYKTKNQTSLITSLNKCIQQLQVENGLQFDQAMLVCSREDIANFVKEYAFHWPST